MGETLSSAEILERAASNAQAAMEALRSDAFAQFPYDEKYLWAMAAVIHCDMCRLITALGECQVESVKILWMGDIVSKLHEANVWYQRHGSPLLLQVAKRKRCGDKAVKTHLRHLKEVTGAGRASSYEVYRNKFGYHYDREGLEHLEAFYGADHTLFLDILKSFVIFTGEWAKLVKAVIRDELEPANA